MISSRCNPLPYWYRQIEKVLLLSREALEGGHGLTVVFKVLPGGKIGDVQYTVKLKALDGDTR